MNGAEAISLAINVGFPLALLVFAYLIGGYLERRHFRQIAARERALRGFMVMTFDRLPEDQVAREATLITGSVVVSLDYFKRIIAGLRAIVGGRVKTYEPLLDRARREAMLRLLEQARAAGFDAVINVRLQTSRIASARGDQGTAGVEMLAFGTAVRLAPAA
ncbi:MAG: heavy metal-binding domain-containing protein [Pseudomonadota bacterium]